MYGVTEPIGQMAKAVADYLIANTLTIDSIKFVSIEVWPDSRYAEYKENSVPTMEQNYITKYNCRDLGFNIA